MEQMLLEKSELEVKYVRAVAGSRNPTLRVP